MLCELLTTSIKNYPTFDPKQLLPVLRAQVMTWPDSGAKDRPDFHCLNEVWTFGEQQVDQRMADAGDVAKVLEFLIVEGKIDPFVDIHPSMVDSHPLTSRTPVSRSLCDRLRKLFPVFMNQGQALSPFVRAVVLGFRWSEPVHELGRLQFIAERSAKPEDLLLGVQLASAMAADRDGAGIPDEANGSVRQFRAVCDGVYRCLSQRPERSKACASVVSIIELERVIEGMVELLTTADGVAPERAEAISRDCFGDSAESGPLSHLRSYVALGHPLMSLVGDMIDAEVRRGIERLMDRVDPKVLPGFPTIASTSRRPSDLLRRLRYLVRCMLLKASEPDAPKIFLDFRVALFHGSDSRPELAAAKIAFSRQRSSDGGQGAQLIGAQLAGLALKTGLDSAADPQTHPCMAALRCAVLVDVDTWSLVNDGDSIDVPGAVLQILRQLAIAKGQPVNQYVSQVFDLSVCARAREANEREQGERRHGLFAAIDRLHRSAHGQSDETLRNAISEGLPAFRKLITANFHREFDREKLHGIACLGIFDQVDRASGESVRSGNGKECRSWLIQWAFLSAPSPYVGALQSIPDADVSALVAEIVAAPFALDPYSGGSRVFVLADAAAAGSDVAGQAVLQLAQREDAAQIFQNIGDDALGRPIGFAIAQACSETLMDQLFGAWAGFKLHLGPSVDAVTPVMAAARFASNDDNARKLGFDEVRRCDGHVSGPDRRRDRRGWRAIHHAFAAGHVDAARRLVEADPACVEYMDGDGTTFLIEAFRCEPGVADPSVVIEFALSLLRKMEPQARLRLFEFRGPIGLDGAPRSLVSAALPDSSRWSQFIAMIGEFADARGLASIWKDVGAVTLSKLLDSRDFIRFAELCEHVAAAGGDSALAALAGTLSGEPLAVRVALKVSNSREAVAAQAKCWELRRHGAFDVAAISPFDGGNMLHALVKAATNARADVEDLREGPELEAAVSQYRAFLPDLFAFAVQAASGHKGASSALVQARDFDHESPIWKATRVGMPVLALAYARFLGAPAGPEDSRWLLAARFLKETGRYQDGVRSEYRISIDEDRYLILGVGGGRVVRLSGKPLPRELSSRNARAWLQHNATAIAQSLQAYIGTDLDVGAYAFINWLAHLASDSTQA